MKTIRLVTIILSSFQLAFGQQMIRNLSFRAQVGTGNDVVIAGFVTKTIPGAAFGAKKTLLIRAVGPTLGRAPFNLPGTIATPKLELFKGSTLVTSNQGWSGSAQIQAATNQVGAFPLALGSADSVIFADIEAGAYTAVVSGGTGIVLFELYDVSRDAEKIEIINISARARVIGNGIQAGIVGMVVDGIGLRQILVRVSGPELAGFGVSDNLADPILTAFNAQGVALSTNNDWGNTTVLSTAFNQVGAFPFPATSKSSALIMSTAGRGTESYTFRGGQDGGSGVVIIEAYRL